MDRIERMKNLRANYKAKNSYDPLAGVNFLEVLAGSELIIKSFSQRQEPPPPPPPKAPPKVVSSEDVSVAQVNLTYDNIQKLQKNLQGVTERPASPRNLQSVTRPAARAEFGPQRKVVRCLVVQGSKGRILSENESNVPLSPTVTRTKSEPVLHTPPKPTPGSLMTVRSAAVLPTPGKIQRRLL